MWWIRYLEFVRIQLLIVLIVLLLLYSVLGRLSGLLGGMTIGLARLAIGYNFYKVYPYIPFWQEDAIEVAECPAGSRRRVLVANVQKTNEQAQELFSRVRSADPDLLLVLETDQWRDERLAQLGDQFPNRVQHIPQGHAFLGVHLLSRYELIDPEMKFLFDNFTPSIVTGVRLPDGSAVSLFGLHPQPPQSWPQPTAMRDAHLITAALQARDAQAPGILAGDFNAVPWERVTRRVMRLGKLLDPRVGRGLYSTYHAQSIFLSWPLDQVLYQNKFALLEFKRLPAFGSDLYAILVTLCHLPAAASRQSAPHWKMGMFGRPKHRSKLPASSSPQATDAEGRLLSVAGYGPTSLRYLPFREVFRYCCIGRGVGDDIVARLGAERCVADCHLEQVLAPARFSIGLGWQARRRACQNANTSFPSTMSAYTVGAALRR